MKQGTLYYLGSDASDDPYHRSGVGVFITKEYQRCVKYFVPISDKVMLIQLDCHPFPVNLNRVYVPTSDKKYDNDVERLYETINQTLRTLKCHHINIVMGDFNAKIGVGRQDDTLSGYGMDGLKQKVDRLFEVCQEAYIKIAST